MTERKVGKTILPYEMEAIGILNPYGQIWSRNTFETVDAAKAYVRDFWKGRPEGELERYRYIPVNVTITYRQGTNEQPS